MMDDSCAVCAEELEWVAYGPCGHREVCATCVARLRVVCKDCRCCLCQSDSSVVFVTKALGEYTRSINDFSTFPDAVIEGKVGSFWYHEGIQAFFDDFNQYKAIRAMSKLSCIVCDKSGKEGSKRKGKFKSIDQLRSHVSNRHDLYMCSLCLEGRKVFLTEQKLYSRAQLERHFEKGDLEVDGDESERCGFSGHPLCEFCQLNFYGDNELYFHLSTDHFTCHICQRQHPGLHQYYGNYDDLEKHFRHTHYLCEDFSCLEKKFIVFSTAAEIKRHRTSEHGGNMSLSECNASLQISACFGHRERNEGDNSRSRAVGRTANAELLHGISSSTRRANGSSSIATTNLVSSAERASVHSQASAPNSSNGVLEDSAFPPLPSSSNRRHCTSRNTSTGKTKAPQLHRRYDGSLTVVNSSSSLPAPNAQPSSSSSSSSRAMDTSTVGVSLNTVRSNTSTSSEHSTGGGNQKTEEIRTAEPLVGRIRAELGSDKDKFAAFKLVSKEYRQSVISAKEYLAYVHQFGLSHLVVDLARLCPDPEKQMELLQAHNIGFGGSDGAKITLEGEIDKHGSKKGKQKCIDHQSSSAADFQRERDKNGNENGVTSVDSKGKSTVTFDAESKTKQKKTPKFLRARLGEGSGSGVLDPDEPKSSLNRTKVSSGRSAGLSGIPGGGGVWQNGGGQKLVMKMAKPLSLGSRR